MRLLSFRGLSRILNVGPLALISWGPCPADSKPLGDSLYLPPAAGKNVSCNLLRVEVGGA